MGARDHVGRPVRDAVPEFAGQGYVALPDRVYRTGEPYFGSASRAEFEIGGQPVVAREASLAPPQAVQSSSIQVGA